MKKFVSIILMLVFAFSLTSCNGDDGFVVVAKPDKDYKIERNGDNYYLDLNGRLYRYSNSIKDSCVEAPTLHFESLEQIKDKFLNGKFSEEEKKTLAKFRKNEDGKIPLLNFDNLYKPTIPDDATVEYFAMLSGDKYLMAFSSKTIDSGRFDIYTEEEEPYKSLQSFDTVKTSEYYKVVTDKEREATVYFYKNENGVEFKSIRYTVAGDGRILTVNEYYMLNGDTAFGENSDILPYRVLVYEFSDNFCYTFTLHGLTERPSVEWLSQFGVEPLETE